MKIAVTGAQGFIGSHMVDFLFKKGHNVISLGSDLDLRQYDKRMKWAFEGVDQVYHFAAHIGGVGYLSKNNYYPFIDNMTMDLNILKVCEEMGVKRLFYSSSVCAYPLDTQQDSSNIPYFKESQLVPANADQMYGWEKLMMILLARHSPLDLRVGIFNTIFGEGQEWEGEKSKFPPAMTYKVLQSKRTGQPIRIWGDGTQARTFLYIDDAIEKIFEVMDTDEYWGEVNIANNEVSTVEQCVDWLCEIAGIKPDYIFDMDEPTGPMARGIDNSKFEKHYKYRNRFTTKQGLEKLYKWMEKEIK